MSKITKLRGVQVDHKGIKMAERVPAIVFELTEKLPMLSL